MCLKWFCRKYCSKSEDMPKPNNLEDIDISDIYGILKAEYPDCPIYLRDKKYKTTDIPCLMEYLKYDLTDEYDYKDEYYDCDDFTFRLLGNLSNPVWGCLPFGFIDVEIGNGYGHTLNIFIDKNSEVWLVEPQNDTVQKTPNNWTARMIII